MNRSSELRPSNAERVPYEQALGQAHAEGRLDLETYEQRMLEVAEATSTTALERTVADVPFTLHAERAALARRSRTRRAFLGIAGLAAVAGASFWATTVIPEPAAAPVTAPPSTAAPTPSAPSPSRPAGNIATTMVQVPFGEKDSFPTLASHLEASGITGVSRVQMHGEFVTVQAERGGESLLVSYRTDWAPEIASTDPTGRPTLPPSQLVSVDAAGLLERAREVLHLGDDPRIDLRWYREEWVLGVTGADETRYWDITGTELLPDW